MAARVQLCGTLAVEWDGEPIAASLPGRQGRLLFAYLVLHRSRAATRDELAEAIGTREIAPVLSRLRGVLGDAVVGRGDVRLELPEGSWVDWEAAHHGVERARSAMRVRAWADAWGPASAARAIAERGLLRGLEAEWIEPLRSELSDLRVDALELLARAGVELGGEEVAPAERAARAAVEAAPFRESARAVLMDALRANGNDAEALLVYENARKLLRAELGTTPGPELVARHEALLQADEPPRASTSSAIRRQTRRSVVERGLARLELARALAAAGESTLALRLADQCGAVVLAAELRATGTALAEAAALSSIERQVADLAAAGHDATAIAQALFLTPKTARDHLESAARKLGATGPRGARRAPLSAC
jgi:DNA-binding SARP family transcriptional activator/DNA-binding CsgD family transcriptional regulator